MPLPCPGEFKLVPVPPSISNHSYTRVAFGEILNENSPTASRPAEPAPLALVSTGKPESKRCSTASVVMVVLSDV